MAHRLRKGVNIEINIAQPTLFQIQCKIIPPMEIPGYYIKILTCGTPWSSCCDCKGSGSMSRYLNKDKDSGQETPKGPFSHPVPGQENNNKKSTASHSTMHLQSSNWQEVNSKRRKKRERRRLF